MSEDRPPLAEHGLVRTGVYAWSVVGVAAAAVLIGYLLATFSIVVIPFVLALFPTAVLLPVQVWLERRGLPQAAAATVCVFGTLLLFAGIFALMAASVQAQLDELIPQVQEGYEELRTRLENGAFGLPAVNVDQLLQRVRQGLGGSGGGGAQAAVQAARSTIEAIAMFLLLLVAWFFYLKDRDRIARWLNRMFPSTVRDDASEVGTRIWTTLEGYIRGQSLIALVDAVGIGIGLALLGVPLALALSLLVFFGAYVPTVGSFVAGTVAVLVALAANGLASALAVLGLIIAVQQLEGNLLTPIVLGRSTSLHPLGVLGALTAGAAVFGVLGAILAVPIAASAWRAFGYLREQADAGRF